MTLILPLSSDAEAKLREHAAAAGMELTTFVMEAIEQKLAAASANPARASEMSLEEFDRWLDELSAGTERLPSLPTDFSRADIYQDHD